MAVRVLMAYVPRCLRGKFEMPSEPVEDVSSSYRWPH